MFVPSNVCGHNKLCRKSVCRRGIGRTPVHSVWAGWIMRHIHTQLKRKNATTATATDVYNIFMVVRAPRFENLPPLYQNPINYFQFWQILQFFFSRSAAAAADVVLAVLDSIYAKIYRSKNALFVMLCGLEKMQLQLNFNWTTIQRIRSQTELKTTKTKSEKKAKWKQVCMCTTNKCGPFDP